MHRTGHDYRRYRRFRSVFAPGGWSQKLGIRSLISAGAYTALSLDRAPLRPSLGRTSLPSVGQPLRRGGKVLMIQDLG